MSATGSLLADLGDVYVAPRAAFERITARPRPWLPFVGFVLLGIVFNAFWIRKADPAELMRVQIEESGRAERMTAEQREAVIEQQASFFPVMAWMGPLLFAPLMLLAVTGLYLFIFGFLYGAEVSFTQALTVVSWVFFAVGLVTTPLTLAVLALKGEWSVDPRFALHANLSLALDKSATPAFFWSLAESLDLFSFWMLALLSVGFAAAARRPTSWAVAGVVGLWAVYVVIKSGLASLF